MAICIPEKSKNIWDFDPRSVPGCQVWFDGADTSTITGSSTVTAWKDKSRNAWNATTLIGTAPTNTTVNGLNAVSFAGQSTLTVSNVAFSSVQSRAIFVVYRVPTSAPNYISWFGTQAFNINNQGGHNNLVYPSGGGGPYLQSYAVGGAVQGMGADAVSTIGTTAITCMIHSAVSTSRNTVTLNGTSYALSTNTLASGYGSGTVTYYIGNAYPQAYILCEYILYQEEFTVAQRQQVEGYLAHKWGIKTSLPATHPSYSIKPYLRSFQPVDISGCELWFDGGDSTTMFQNTAGTTHVTAAAQSVACWKDKIRNLSLTDTGIDGRASVAPSSVSGGGVLFNNVNTSPSSSTQSLGAFSSGATNQTSFLFRMPTKSMTLIIATLPLSNNGYRRICLMGSYPLSGGPPNFLIGPQMGASEGGTIVIDLNAGMSAWGQELGTTSGYNSSAVLRIDTLTVDTTGSWFTNGVANTPTTNTSYTSTNSNYPVNFIYFAGYSSTIDGGRSFNGTIYEMLLYSKVLSTSERQQVEGYLANKWKLQSSFPSTFPFRTLPSSSTLPFLPTNFSRCVLWLDPTDTSTVTLNGSNVSQLNDKSGLGYNMTQATSGNQPTYSTALNGNRMLTFTQASSTRLSNSSFPAFIGSGSASYFLVEYNMTAPSGNPSPFGYSAGPNSGLIMQYNPGFTGGLQPFSTGVSSFTSATPRLIFLYKENVGSTNMIGFINGTSQTVSDTTSGTYSGTFNVGSGTNGFISGNICELIIFNRSLTTAERQQIEGYLAYKWGIQYSLPSTHPYIKFQPAQTSFILPGTIATVTLSALSGSGGTITWTTSTNAVNYKWFVGTTFPTVLVSGTVGAVLTTAVSFAFVASTNYFAWVIPVSSTESDGATTQSAAASYTAGGDITSANLNTIATYLRSYMSEFRNPSFYGYNLDGTSYYISDGGGDMYDAGNMTYPWLISGTQFTTASINQQAFSINYSATTATTIDTDFIYASLGYTQGTGVSSIHPLTVLGFRSTVGRPVGFQLSGNSGADGGGTLASGILYAGSVFYGFTVHAFYRETYNASDPSHCNLFILLGHTNWSSVFGTISSFADPVSNGGNGAYFFTSGAGVKNILAVQTLLSKSGGALVSAAECQTVVQAFAYRIGLALGF